MSKLRPESKMVVVDYGGVISIAPVPQNPIKEVRGSLKGGPSLTKELLKERAAEREREEMKSKRFSG
jgi:hypothetical protein